MLSLKRRINDRVASWVQERRSYDNSHLINRWMSICLGFHEECKLRELVSLYSDNETILLVDVNRMCLVQSTISEAFVALSYVWGGVNQFFTTKSNVDRLFKAKALCGVRPEMSTVILDAIALVAQLGSKYLWVDALCIIQDDERQKAKSIELMAEIYNRATVTIIACSGTKASSRLTQCPEVFTAKQPKPVPGQYNLIHRPLDTIRIQVKFENSQYNQRGWTYQERILSRRRLYFFKDEVYFQCRRDSFGGIGVTELATDSHLSMSQSEQWKFQNLEFRGNFFITVAHELSSKQFSYEDDVLRACSGIISAFENKSKQVFVAGLPMSFMHLALQWVPLLSASEHKENGSISRRRRHTARQSGASTCTAYSDYHAYLPSWSWAGWLGEVSFALIYDDYPRPRILVFRSFIESITLSSETHSLTFRLPLGPRCARCSATSSTSSSSSTTTITPTSSGVTSTPSWPTVTSPFDPRPHCALCFKIRDRIPWSPHPSLPYPHDLKPAVAAISRATPYTLAFTADTLPLRALTAHLLPRSRGPQWLLRAGSPPTPVGIFYGVWRGAWTAPTAGGRAADLVLLSQGQAPFSLDLRTAHPVDEAAREGLHVELFGARGAAYNALVVEWEGGVAERVGFAQVVPGWWGGMGRARKRVVLR